VTTTSTLKNINKNQIKLEGKRFEKINVM